MQFVSHGPDIPERLLQAHEDGRVVFFCGAGISYPARLPGFSGLVQRLYDALGETPNAVQQAAIKAGQFDTAIGLLEANIVGGREIVRRALASILTPDLRAPNATVTHEALLTLSKTRDGRTRLITTNFDRLFEEVIGSKRLTVECFQAPLLPVPKNRWDGLVYLHGLLSSAPTISELDRLVASSGDFGLAYLTERWAARFVSELFRNYTVCFVGYSINDPVLRYMMDALAADRLLGESPPEMFAFGSYSKGKEDECANEWRAKNVTPILYRAHNHHGYLHKTLRAWAHTYRDGVIGKERIIVECAIARPLASTRHDDFVGRLLWALSDRQGLPAKRFANIDPVPTLDWLGPLSEERYNHSDLSRFGVPPHPLKNEKLAFSLTYRPSPYDHSPWMAMTSTGNACGQWDDVMHHLACWLVRHLDDPALILWIAKRGGKLHPRFAWLIDHRLDELAKLERDGNTEALDNIKSSSPNAIPRPMLRVLWRLLLTGRVKTHQHDFNLYSWQNRFKSDGFTTTLRLELREMLSPRVSLREPIRLSEGRDTHNKPENLKEIVEWEILLSSDHVHSALNENPTTPEWTSALPELLNDFNTLLRDTLDLMRELDGADDHSDRSYWDMPSISPHWQNRNYNEWTALIVALRDAWLATLEQDTVRARRIAEEWWVQPYPTFKRLALFAMANDKIDIDGKWVDWLLADNAWWLWSTETKREVMRLVVQRGSSLPANKCAHLETSILIGPPRAMFIDDIEPDRWADIIDHSVWLLLSKHASNGTRLGHEAQTRLEDLSTSHPRWQLAQNESDEFSHWMSGSGDPDEHEWRRFEEVPRRRRELMEWLLRSPSTDPFHENNWRDVCREQFSIAACALFALARDGQWPTERWREALQVWSEEKLINRSWRYIAPVLANAPDDFLHSLAHGTSWWLQSIAKTFNGHEMHFLDLCRRILAMEHSDGVDTDDPVMRAINHPVGHATEALLRWWYRRSPDDGQGLPDELSPIFTELCNTQVNRFRHGRVLLAAHVISLFRVDPDWTTQYLLPLFDWQRSADEARAAWEGFLWSPRLYRPLMEAIKEPFLNTARHYQALGKHDAQYAALLTFASLDPGDTFSVAELAGATRSLPADGLRDVSHTLARALEGAGDQRSDYWANRVVPYLRSIWPKKREHLTQAISDNLARLCVAAHEKFPEALLTLRPWLQVPQYPDVLVHLLNEAKISALFPDDVLTFLDLIIPDSTAWPPSDLRACLESIRSTAPRLVEDTRFIRLMAYLRRHGK